MYHRDRRPGRPDRISVSRVVQWEHVGPFIKQFRTLDVDRSGRLGMKDLNLIKAMGKEDLDKLRAKLGQEGQLRVHGLSGKARTSPEEVKV